MNFIKTIVMPIALISCTVYSMEQGTLHVDPRGAKLSLTADLKYGDAVIHSHYIFYNINADGTTDFSSQRLLPNIINNPRHNYRSIIQLQSIAGNGALIKYAVLAKHQASPTQKPEKIGYNDVMIGINTGKSSPLVIPNSMYSLELYASLTNKGSRTHRH